jgi:GTP-binding protein
MSLFHQAAFVTSVADLRLLPHSEGEIAFAGRSNAGKSSALNVLTRRHKLAFVSKTPGRTQLLNFFALGSQPRFLVDLPGYGYAKVPQPVRASWEALLGEYLRTRGPLQGLALIMDVRHPLTELDHRMLGWFAPTGKPVHILLTKSDKLSRVAALAVLRDVQKELSEIGPNLSAQLFSSLKKSGVEEAETVLGSWLGLPPPPPAPTPAKRKEAPHTRRLKK